MELPLAEVLADMEQRGIRTDPATCQGLADDLEARSRCLRRRPSPGAAALQPQLPPRRLPASLRGARPEAQTQDQDRLLDRSGRADGARAPSTNCRARYWSTARSPSSKTTYVDQLLRFRDPATGRIHASFNQTVTATGRLSSSDPNLQNIPDQGRPGRRDQEGLRARGATIG